MSYDVSFCRCVGTNIILQKDDRISSVCNALYIVFLHTHTHTHPNRGSLYPTYVRVQNEGVDFGKKTLFKFTEASVYTRACTVTFGGGANFELCVIGDRQNLKRIIYYIIHEHIYSMPTTK